MPYLTCSNRVMNACVSPAMMSEDDRSQTRNVPINNKGWNIEDTKSFSPCKRGKEIGERCHDMKEVRITYCMIEVGMR